MFTGQQFIELYSIDNSYFFVEKILLIRYLSCIGHIYISASANICNVMLMRNSELTEGIAVMDSQNNVVGTSKVAAKKVSVFVLYGWDI